MNDLLTVRDGVKRLLVATCLLVFSISVFGTIEVIENPRPTHFEKNATFVKLELVHEIPLDISDEIFMADPYYLTTGPDGSLYVFDRVIKKIFQFDKNYKFVRTFGNKGSGPGEFGFGRDFLPIRFSYDGHLYVGEHESQRIAKFSPSGKHIKDIRLSSGLMTGGPFVPCVDKSGIHYILDWKNHQIKAVDEKMNTLYSLFNKKDFERVLYVKLSGMDARHWVIPDLRTIKFDVLPNNRLIVYNANGSCVYIFEKDKLVRKFNFWPEMALKYYKKIAEHRHKNRRSREIFSCIMSYAFFIDRDNEKYFYLQGSIEGKIKHLHYRFDLEGKLDKIVYTEKYVKLMEKRNNLFYGIKNGSVQIYKEVSDDKKCI